MDPEDRLAEAEKQLRIAREDLAAEEVDIRQNDLWMCWECCVPHLNVGQPRECTICGGALEYQGELDYRNKSLGTGGDNGGE